LLYAVILLLQRDDNTTYRYFYLVMVVDATAR
jgi:hypothetical protein